MKKIKTKKNNLLILDFVKVGVFNNVLTNRFWSYIIKASCENYNAGNKGFSHFRLPLVSTELVCSDVTGCSEGCEVTPAPEDV